MFLMVCKLTCMCMLTRGRSVRAGRTGCADHVRGARGAPRPLLAPGPTPPRRVVGRLRCIIPHPGFSALASYMKPPSFTYPKNRLLGVA